MQTATGGAVGRRLNARIDGSGRQPMLFAHGFGCDQSMWRYVAPAFEQRYRTVLFDYVGCGKSDWAAYRPARYATLDGYASDILELAHALDLEDIVFVGHSVSAMIGALAAIREPARFSRLVIIGPSPCYMNVGEYRGGFAREDLEGLLQLMEKNNVGWAEYLAPIVIGNDRPDLVRELEASFCASDPRATRGFARATFLSDHRADVPKIPVPSLVMQCSADAIAPEPVGEWMATRMQDATLVRLAATGHAPQMSHPQETIAVMNRYLEEAFA